MYVCLVICIVCILVYLCAFVCWYTVYRYIYACVCICMESGCESPGSLQLYFVLEGRFSHFILDHLN